MGSETGRRLHEAIRPFLLEIVVGGQSEDVLIGGKSPKVQRASKRNWSKKKQEQFLTVLAETCNVTRACEAAGVATSQAYRRKSENAAFRAAWLAAVSVAYQRLELMLLDRAFNGTEKIVTRKDGSEDRMREYSDQLGLQLLKMHRATAVEAEAELPAANAEEMRAQLVKKLVRLKERLETEEAPE